LIAAWDQSQFVTVVASHNASAICGLTPGFGPTGGQGAPTLSRLIVSLSLAALTLSLGIAASFSLIVWAVG
jgi:hypothetical protein